MECKYEKLFGVNALVGVYFYFHINVFNNIFFFNKYRYQYPLKKNRNTYRINFNLSFSIIIINDLYANHCIILLEYNFLL